MDEFTRIEITYKNGYTKVYDKGEWDDYGFVGNAIIVKKNDAWVGIYNFDEVFSVEIK